MRRLGDPRTVAVLERGLRGSPFLPRNSFIRGSFSGASAGRGRGRGIGTAEEDGQNTGGFRRGRGGAVFHQEIVEESYEVDTRVSELGVPRTSRVAPVGAGRGRGVTAAPHQEATRDLFSSSGAEQFGRGRGSPSSPQQAAGSGSSFAPPHDEGSDRRLSPLPLSLKAGSPGAKALPLREDADVSELGAAKADGTYASPGEENGRQESQLDQEKIMESPKLDPQPHAGERKLSAVEKLLLGLGLSEPEVTTSPQPPAPAETPKSPFRMPFARPSSPTEQIQVNTPFRMPFARPSSPTEQIQVKAPKPIFKTAAISLGAVGRGRGQADDITKPPIGSDPDLVQSPPRRFDRIPERPQGQSAVVSQPAFDQDLMQSPPSKVDRMAEGFREHFGSVTQPSVEFEPDVQRGFDRMPESSWQESSPQRTGSPGDGDGRMWQEPLSPGRFDGMPESGRQSSPSRRFDRTPESGRRRPIQPASPRLQLSVEEARNRAMSILEQGLEKNVAAEGERRRKAGIEKFADAAEFLADKLRREPGQSPSQTQRPRSERERSARRGDRPRRQRSANEVMVAESEAAVQLTPEQEEKILKMQEEDTFKERLHTLFLLQFEPEYAMEEFGTNPYIDEPPVVPLEEYLQSLKPMFLSENAELSEEQEWEEAIKSSLAKAPNLEKLVEAYAGPGQLTAQEQIGSLQTISQKLQPTVAPEVAAFTERALTTLQNNPSLRFRDKERLMRRIVSGFSSG